MSFNQVLTRLDNTKARIRISVNMKSQTWILDLRESGTDRTRIDFYRLDPSPNPDGSREEISCLKCWMFSFDGRSCWINTVL
jgi:hypothetical protein